MKFIPKQNKKARLLGQALGRSLNIDTAEANNAVAVMYGYSRWDSLCKAMQKSTPSMWDEEVSHDVAATREAILVERLSACMQLEPDATRTLVQHLKPTSQSKSQSFSTDRGRSPRPNTGQGTDFDVITKAFDMTGSPAGADRMMENLLKEAMGAAGEEVRDDFDFSNLNDRARTAGPVDPGAYFDIFQSLGWPLDESSFEETYVYGEPSFFAESHLGHVPVYITSLAMTPENDADGMAQEVMAITEEDNCKNMETERFILMWGQPQVKVIDGGEYSCWGRLWQDGQWRDFLINGEMTSADKLFDMNPLGQSINRPHKAQADPKHELAASVVIFMQGLQQQRDKVKMGTIQTASGWNTLMPSLDKQ
ncbi:MAG: hypothetical protein V7739_15100 [Motiliproteus sp.]